MSRRSRHSITPATDFEITVDCWRDREEERVALGDVLIHPGQGAVYVDVGYAPDLFGASEHHRQIMAGIAALVQTGVEPDLAAVRRWLLQRHTAFPMTMLYTMPDGVPRQSRANIEARYQHLDVLARCRAVYYGERRLLLDLARAPAGVLNGAVTRRLTELEALQTPRSPAASASLFCMPRDLAVTAQVDWIIPRFWAVGATTELTGKAKVAGKSTLVLFWIRCALTGDLCFGDMASTSPVVLLTEQTPASLRPMLARADLLERSDLSILFHSSVALTPWREIVRLAVTEARRIGARALVIDTLPQFAGFRGDAENNAGDALEALAPLQAAAASGLAPMIIRHDRKGTSEIGESGRGSSAFAGGVDVMLRLSRPDGNQRPTIRKLEGLSRFQETPALSLIELVTDSSFSPPLGVEVRTERFVALGDDEAVATEAARQLLEDRLPESATDAIRLEEIEGADRSALRRALTLMGSAVGKVGAGKKGDPYRYFKAVPGFWSNLTP